jgi:hypothetical protein
MLGAIAKASPSGHRLGRHSNLVSDRAQGHEDCPLQRDRTSRYRFDNLAGNLARGRATIIIWRGLLERYSMSTMVDVALIAEAISKIAP